MSRTPRFLSAFILLMVILSLLNFLIIKTFDASLPDEAIFDAHSRNHSTAAALARVNKSKGSRPPFILHIGPHKSATTSIQCALYRYRKILKNQDSILFLGKVDERFCDLPENDRPILQDQRIQKLTECMGNTDCWKKLIAEWEENKRNGLGMVLSKEGISDLASSKHSLESERAIFWPALEDALIGWNVTVVVTYRRFFEWLPSAFNQHAFHMRLQKREPWPTAPQLPQTVEEVIAGIVRGQTPPPYPFVDTLLQRQFPPHWNSYVMNMHRTSDVVRAFLCEEVLQDAKQTCSTYQPAPLSRQSPSEDLVYDYLNVGALHRGWMSSGRRGQRARSTKTFVQNVLKLSPNDFPKSCPSRSLLEPFLEYSIAMERRILGKVDIQDHLEQFWKSARNFCTVNATAVLTANQSLWKQFYASL